MPTARRVRLRTHLNLLTARATSDATTTRIVTAPAANRPFSNRPCYILMLRLSFSSNSWPYSWIFRSSLALMSLYWSLTNSASCLHFCSSTLSCYAAIWPLFRWLMISCLATKYARTTKPSITGTNAKIPHNRLQLFVSALSRPNHATEVSSVYCV